MIYLLRHGQTDWNVAERVQGITNIPLNEIGIKQAEEARDELKDVKFDVAFTSPLDRALDTTSIIAGDTETIIDDRLIERSYGGIEGALISSIESFRKLHSDENLGIESIDNLRDRTEEFCQELEDKYSNRNVLIVTHAAVIAFLRVYFEGEPADHDYMKLVPKNCEIIKYKNRKRVRSLSLGEK